jgi:hypothetical protein
MFYKIHYILPHLKVLFSFCHNGFYKELEGLIPSAISAKDPSVQHLRTLFILKL